MTEASKELVGYTHIIYGLHALSVLIAITGAGSIVGNFIFGVPSIIAVIMNYSRRSEVHTTWLATHFHWQICTFWFALLWVIAVLIISAPLVLFVVGIFTAWFGLSLVGLWVIYRVARGWLALRAGNSL